MDDQAIFETGDEQPLHNPRLTPQRCPTAADEGTGHGLGADELQSRGGGPGKEQREIADVKEGAAEEPQLATAVKDTGRPDAIVAQPPTEGLVEGHPKTIGSALQQPVAGMHNNSRQDGFVGAAPMEVDAADECAGKAATPAAAAAAAAIAHAIPAGGPGESGMDGKECEGSTKTGKASQLQQPQPTQLECLQGDQQLLLQQQTAQHQGQPHVCKEQPWEQPDRQSSQSEGRPMPPEHQPVKQDTPGGQQQEHQAKEEAPAEGQQLHDVIVEALFEQQAAEQEAPAGQHQQQHTKQDVAAEQQQQQSERNAQGEYQPGSREGVHKEKQCRIHEQLHDPPRFSAVKQEHQKQPEPWDMSLEQQQEQPPPLQPSQTQDPAGVGSPARHSEERMQGRAGSPSKHQGAAHAQHAASSDSLSRGQGSASGLEAGKVLPNAAAHSPCNSLDGQARGADRDAVDWREEAREEVGEKGSHGEGRGHNGEGAVMEAEARGAGQQLEQVGGAGGQGPDKDRQERGEHAGKGAGGAADSGQRHEEAGSREQGTGSEPRSRERQGGPDAGQRLSKEAGQDESEAQARNKEPAAAAAAGAQRARSDGGGGGRGGSSRPLVYVELRPVVGEQGEEGVVVRTRVATMALSLAELEARTKRDQERERGRQRQKEREDRERAKEAERARQREKAELDRERARRADNGSVGHMRDGATDTGRERLREGQPRPRPVGSVERGLDREREHGRAPPGVSRDRDRSLSRQQPSPSPARRPASTTAAAAAAKPAPRHSGGSQRARTPPPLHAHALACGRDGRRVYESGGGSSGRDPEDAPPGFKRARTGYTLPLPPSSPSFDDPRPPPGMDRRVPRKPYPDSRPSYRPHPRGPPPGYEEDMYEEAYEEAYDRGRLLPAVCGMAPRAAAYASAGPPPPSRAPYIVDRYASRHPYDSPSYTDEDAYAPVPRGRDVLRSGPPPLVPHPALRHRSRTPPPPSPRMHRSSGSSMRSSGYAPPDAPAPCAVDPRSVGSRWPGRDSGTGADGYPDNPRRAPVREPLERGSSMPVGGRRGDGGYVHDPRDAHDPRPARSPPPLRPPAASARPAAAMGGRDAYERVPVPSKPGPHPPPTFSKQTVSQQQERERETYEAAAAVAPMPRRGMAGGLANDRKQPPHPAAYGASSKHKRLGPEEEAEEDAYGRGARPYGFDIHRPTPVRSSGYADSRHAPSPLPPARAPAYEPAAPRGRQAPLPLHPLYAKQGGDPRARDSGSGGGYVRPRSFSQGRSPPPDAPPAKRSRMEAPAPDYRPPHPQHSIAQPRDSRPYPAEAVRPAAARGGAGPRGDAASTGPGAWKTDKWPPSSPPRRPAAPYDRSLAGGGRSGSYAPPPRGHAGPPSSHTRGGGGSAPGRGRAGALPFDENSKVWYYRDPAGNQQGPCSVAQFKLWITNMARDPNLTAQLEQFKAVDVWDIDDRRPVQLMSLLRL